MSEQPYLFEIERSEIATISLNRPEVHNALDESMVTALVDILHSIDRDTNIRLLVLKSTSKNFCAGVDLNWMKRSASNTRTENRNDALKLLELIKSLHSLSKPTLALVNGAAYGGGAGLVACCDIAIAASNARFGFSEVRLGLIPSIISPFVIRKIGDPAARRYFLTGENFSAEEARRIGLVQEISEADQLESKANDIFQAIKAGGPEAQSRTKKLLDDIANSPLTESLLRKTAQWIADVRQDDEAKAGIKAFFEKRNPPWAAG